MTVATPVDAEIEECLASSPRPLSNSTKEVYGGALRMFWLWAGGHLPQSWDEARQFLRYREDQGLADGTVAQNAYALQLYLQWKRLDDRPLPHQPIEMAEPREVSLEEVQALLDSCDLPVIKCTVALTYDTGARIAEILRLEVADIEWDGYVTVVRKGGKRQRTSLSDWGLTYLKRWMEERSQPDHPKVFGGLGDMKGRQPQGYKQVYYEFKKAARRAGLPEQFSPHWLRHARVQHLRDQGVDWVIIADQVGHRNATMTMNVYGRRKPETVRRMLPTPELV